MQGVIFFMMLVAFPAIAVGSDVAVQAFEKDAKNRPVTKVINLLKDMVDQLEKEGEEDEEVYETMGCWCVTNEKAKTKSIAEAETDIETLSASIEALTAQSAKLNTEIANLEAEISKHTEALETATSLREKELAEFTEFEKDSLVNIAQLKAAVISLNKLHAAALLKKNSKLGTTETQKVEEADSKSTAWSNEFKKIDFVKQIEAEANRPAIPRIEGIPNKYIPEVENACIEVNRDSFEPVLLQDQKPQTKQQKKEQQRRTITAFLHDVNSDRIKSKKGSSNPLHDRGHYYKTPEIPAHIQSLLCKVFKGVDTGLLESDMDDSETGNTEYEPASGAIFGILKQMKESFETNLAQAQDAEAKAAYEFDEMKAAKEKEIQTSTDLVDKKMGELARTDEKNAEAKENKDDTEAALAADQAFLADLKERCASMDEEFAARTKGRQLEIEAVSKALAFLNSDEAHDLFTRTFNPVLLQVATVDKRRQAVANMLKTVALKAKDKRVLRLAAKLRKAGDNPAFDKVKEEVDEMIDTLKKEQNDEIKKRDYCIGALNTNERDMGMKERDKEDLIALINDLKVTIDTLEKEIEVLKAEIAELQVQLKRASANREKENAEFQKVVTDQRATAKLLAASLKILAGFYNSAFVQANQNRQKTVAGQAPPPGFKTYEKNAASGGVMGMMQGIIDDAKAMEAECIRAEEKAQKDFEDYVKETNHSIDTKTKSIETKTADKAQAEDDKVQAQKDLDATLTELESLYNEEADLHKECDFLLKNFEISQAARAEEMESLKQANMIFSGASFQEFLQRYTNPDGADQNP